MQAEALGDREQDLCMLIASLSSVLGRVGMVADVAAAESVAWCFSPLQGASPE